MQVLVAACGIKFLHQQLNPGPRYWEHGVLATGPPEKSQNLHFKIFTISAHCHLCQHYSCLNSWWFLFACKSSVHVTVHPSPLDGRWSLDWRNAQHTHTHTHTHTHIHRDKSLSTTPPQLDCRIPEDNDSILLVHNYLGAVLTYVHTPWEFIVGTLSCWELILSN